MECTICPDIWKNFKNYVLDTKKIFSSEFIPKNYHKHLGYSLLLTIPSFLILMFYFHLADTGLFFQTFIGGFGAYFVNWIREWYYGKTYGAPWDQTDVNMGSYGGILGALIAVLIYTLFTI